jgi:hypothetical protein
VKPAIGVPINGLPAGNLLNHCYPDRPLGQFTCSTRQVDPVIENIEFILIPKPAGDLFFLHPDNTHPVYPYSPAKY